ncbi:hypothetical protein PHB09_123 [Pseudomonas phage PHB09]|uniref:Uncharacterized protein n=1 Tax=Pseudomonas phage PHB09 TaxID=2867265 RepID=A0AAE8XGK4_9CAUD|nr:hypothetical protein QGX10_gp122 [Pseudomonas phage PHB09]UAV84618.1 hypothetical protein PHB09_123 [Pseudomonas phage PHB09]
MSQRAFEKRQDKLNLMIDELLLQAVESPQQKQIRELQETIAKAQEQIESLKKVI